MEKVIPFVRKYKTQLLCILCGAIAVIIMRYSVEAFALLFALFFGNEARKTKKEQDKRKAKLQDLQTRQEEVIADIEKARDEGQKRKSQAEKDKAKEVNDFLDGGWD